MKYFITLLLYFSLNFGYAQINTDNIYNTWVLSKITFKDGTVLPDANPLKYTYLKYIFRSPDKFGAATIFSDTRIDRTFAITNGYLLLNSAEGTLINTQKIVELGNHLVLLQAGREGFDDPNSLLFTFVSEDTYQNGIVLRPVDIQSVHNGDTTYVESAKCYASFNTGNFQQFMYGGIADRISMHNRIGREVASFKVSKTGVADSLIILEHIDDEFDKRFIKVFNQAKKEWKPAILNGKFANVQMRVELQYSTTNTMIPAYFAGQKGLSAYNSGNYEIAEYFYDEALKSSPTDKEYLFRRGMCKQLLGNKAGACEDWQQIMSLGGRPDVEALIGKYCK